MSETVNNANPTEENALAKKAAAYDQLVAMEEQRSQSAKRFAALSEGMTKAREDLETRLAAIKGKWEFDNAVLIENHDKAKMQAEEADKEFRAKLVDYYKQFAMNEKNKSKFFPGWGVAVSQKPVYEEATAIKWAIEHKHHEVLKLNASGFAKVAEVIKPDFVTFEPAVTAKKLPQI